MSSLNAKGVRYLVVGGFAVIAHGYVRATKDLDIWIAVDPENAHLAVEMIREFFGVAPAPHILMAPRTIFRIGIIPNRIEIFTHVLGVEFNECYGRRIEAELDGVILPLLSLQDLRKSKAASGRSQDLADLDNLPET